MPAVTEEIKWDNDLCFLVGKKMFFILALEEPFSGSFKVPNEEFDVLTEKKDITPAPYLARAKWVSVTRRSALKEKEWDHYIRQSYQLVKASLPRKTRIELKLE